MKVYACISPSQDPAVSITTSLPCLDDVKQQYFPEIEKIRAGTGAPWTGGDLRAHVASIAQVAAGWWMRPGSQGAVIDFEDPRLPLDGSAACRQWVQATLETWRAMTGKPVGLYNCAAMPELQDFLCPCLYPSNEVIEYPTPLGQSTYAAYVKESLHTLRTFEAQGKHMITACAPRFFATGNVPAFANGAAAKYVPPHIIDLQISLAGAFGDCYFWDNPADKWQAGMFMAQLARLAT